MDQGPKDQNNVTHPFLSFSGADFLQVIGTSTSSRAYSRKHSHLPTAAVVS